jgi:4-hydroxybenzoate polyprenyltransferase
VTTTSTALALARATHLAPTLAVTGLVAALGLATSAGGRTTTLLAAAVLAGQLSVGWSNDWIDAERDAAVGRTDKPVVAGLVAAATLRRAALAAAAACVPLSLALGWRSGLVHLAAVAAAWAYNARLKSTAWSWAPYCFSFGALPSVVTLALPGHPWAPWWATGAGALLGFGAHLANVLPDVEDDARTGVHGLPHRLGRPATTALAAAALLGATVLAVAGPPAPPWGWFALLGAAALAGAGAVVAHRAPSSRFPFTATISVAVLDVALLVLAAADLTHSALA